MSTRRQFIGSSVVLTGAMLGAGSSWLSLAQAADTTAGGAMLKRKIPSSGEAVPVIGVGISIALLTEIEGEIFARAGLILLLGDQQHTAKGIECRFYPNKGGFSSCFFKI